VTLASGPHGPVALHFYSSHPHPNQSIGSITARWEEGPASALTIAEETRALERTRPHPFPLPEPPERGGAARDTFAASDNPPPQPTPPTGKPTRPARDFPRRDLSCPLGSGESLRNLLLVALA